jgi:hypothetical protein
MKKLSDIEERCYSIHYDWVQYRIRQKDWVEQFKENKE